MVHTHGVCEIVKGKGQGTAVSSTPFYLIGSVSHASRGSCFAISDRLSNWIYLKSSALNFDIIDAILTFVVIDYS